MTVIKKDGTKEDFNEQKIITACNKAASRAMVKLTDQDYVMICSEVLDKLIEAGLDEAPIYEMHNVVESVLEEHFPKVAKSYRDYRNYKQDFVHMLDNVFREAQSIKYIGDKNNANTDSSLVATQRSLIYNALNKELYQRFFMTVDELQACRDGYIYCHDMSARLDTFNCCLARVGNIMEGGFEMGNMWYNEPKTLDTAFDVIGDIIMSTASQQYGGYTIFEVDKILSKYAQKSYDKYYAECINMFADTKCDDPLKKADDYAMKKIQRDFEQGFQGWEYKLNSVCSSRGDYPFITMTIGLATDKFGKMASKTMLKVHQEGQGKDGFKRPVLFPKIVFLFDKNLHGEGCVNYDVFEAGIECSSKTMYPDWLSLTGEGYIPEMYKKYGKVVSPMGCVEGNEVITYKWHGRLFVESFARMWDRLSAVYGDVGQRHDADPHRMIELSDSTVEIYDAHKQDFVNVKYLIRNIQSDWCTVTLSGGRVITVTADHPFETQRGVVLAQNLQKTDIIDFESDSYAGSDNGIEPLDAWLDGVILCDGCYQNHSFAISIAAEGEDDIEENVVKALKQYHNADAVTKLQERGEKGTYKDIRVYADKVKSLTDLIGYYENLFEGINKSERHIPAIYFDSSEDVRYAFLAGMIDADGYINNTSKHQNDPVVQLGSTNKELALQQMLLAQTLGMPAKVYINHYDAADKSKIRYRVEFYPNDKLIEAMKCAKKKAHYTAVPAFKAKISGNVSNVEFFTREQYSYDVTTGSEHFDVSGIYSHNCRAFLSPWYERGGMEPADENDVPVFEGRFNCGVVSLNLPMILAKARKESKDFYEVLDYYLELIRGLHKRTYDYIGEMKASVNPVMFCEGGLLGGNLKPDEKIKSILPPMTISYGITALNELQRLYNGKSIREDGQFALEVMQYINDYINRIKKEDGILYAIYGTPAESLCFSGDTLVQTYEGNKPIKDIKRGDLVYSFNEAEHKIELKEVLEAQQTQPSARVMKVTFDNDQSVICTPEHPFAVRKTSQDQKGKFADREHIEYVEAKNLTPGDRIKSNYVHLNSTGRHECSIYHDGQKQLIQQINADYFLGEKPLGYIVHHKDQDKTNNRAENLQYMSAADHRRLHLKDTIAPYKFTSESQAGAKNSFYGKKHTTKAKLLNRIAHIGQPVIQCDTQGQPIRRFECLNDVIKYGFARHFAKLACNGKSALRNYAQFDGHYYRGSLWFYEKDCIPAEANHRVKSVEYMDNMIPVYNIEVKDNNNYFVGGDDGILVHNCGLQVEQFRKMYGIVENVSDRTYVSNSFHCHVTEQMSPIEKQDKEERFWNLFNGGKIQYCRYNLGYNIEAIKTLVLRAMDKGFYEGVNLALCYCEDCGYQQVEMDTCPECGSSHITKIDRMNGYLGYTRVHGETRYNKPKNDEIAERVSM